MRVAGASAALVTLFLTGCSGDQVPPEPTDLAASDTVPPYLAVPEPPGEVVDVGGHRMHLLCTGQGGRTTVLMDAGLGDWSLIFRPLQDDLAPTTRVCTYDRAGYGWSEPVSGPRTGERMVDELEALLEAADEPGPYVLAGHSLGGLTMLLFAEANPDDVAGVVLIDAAHPRQDEALAEVPELVAADEASLAELRGMAARVATGEVGAADLLPLAPGALPLQLRYQWAALSARRHSMETILAEREGARETSGQVGGAGSLGDIPLVVLTAGVGIAEDRPDYGLNWRVAERVDSIWRGLQEDHLHRSTNARLVVAEDSGHYVHLDQPDLVLEAIRSLSSRT